MSFFLGECSRIDKHYQCPILEAVSIGRLMSGLRIFATSGRGLTLKHYQRPLWSDFKPLIIKWDVALEGF